eukprot:CAMPEP_0168532760 /NCGR_PEP_ID=MMETSP0405-20121227/16531_1 /TAXON_ID=498012 /ORGANISM="Trichosphaerium sp, Strain Am-I-7 wt" /LENGTH=103 /DNA_ID=CAMNT_0008558407 /DNA_START=160 /DNA_END=471 /DNA_ORIENTATION=-
MRISSKPEYRIFIRIVSKSKTPAWKMLGDPFHHVETLLKFMLYEHLVSEELNEEGAWEFAGVTEEKVKASFDVILTEGPMPCISLFPEVSRKLYNAYLSSLNY